MYDPQTHSGHKPSMSPDDAAVLSISADMPDATTSLIRRLQSAVVELSTALKETLHDQRTNAAACLQRAQAILQTADNTSAQPAKRAAPRGGLAPWQLRSVLTHIETHIGESIGNKDLAVLARLSESHFNIAFHKSVGRPPHDYIIQRRVARAQGLMLSADVPLCEVAMECGFADQAHFTRLFRTVVGETPAAWRRARANPL
jgi:AraC family transcriptional regulator